MPHASGPSRRLFITRIVAAGGGLLLGVARDGGTSRLNAQTVGSTGPEQELNAWILIRPDETVVIRIARSELGQGTMTGLAQLVAEELDCNWSRVQTELVAPGRNLARKRIWRDFPTTASRGIRGSQEYMRLAGAAARYMMIEAAAELWKVPSIDLAAEDGHVLHPESRRSVSYGRLVPIAVKLAPPDAKVLKLKDPKDWKIAGQPLSRLDQADKISGRAVYGIDVKLPGMLCAAVRDAPVFGATLDSYDATAVLAMPGVRHVLPVDTTGIAVVADTWWQAKVALDALSLKWIEGPDHATDSATIATLVREGLDNKQAFIGHSHGDALKAIAASAKRIEAIYAVPFVHHATLEPMNCTARWSADRVEVWVSTQNPEAALRAAADAAGLPVEKAEVYRMSTGGSFGRRGRQDFVTKAVQVARQIPDVAVKLIWSREEDFARGHYRPISQAKLTGGLDEKGDLTGLILRISGQSVLASLNPRAEPTGRDARMFQGLHPEPGEAQIGYSIPNVYIDHAMRNTHVPVGGWRGVYTNQNAIYLECFIDELASAAGKDPLEFRRQMMKSHPRHLAVLSAVADRAGWADPPPAGQYRGIAQMMAFGSYSAAIAEVAVSPEGELTIHRIIVALDCGHVANPDLATAQIEGSTAFALSALLGEEITISGGRAVESNFDTYSVLKLAQMPHVDVVLMPSGEFWGGVGEASIAVVAPAVLNAIFAATGKRVRTLPIKKTKLR